MRGLNWCTQRHQRRPRCSGADSVHKRLDALGRAAQLSQRSLQQCPRVRVRDATIRISITTIPAPTYRIPPFTLESTHPSIHVRYLEPFVSPPVQVSRYASHSCRADV